MIKDQISDLLKPFDVKTKLLIERVLDHEQRYITYQLGKNSSKKREIIQRIKEEIDNISNK